MGTGGAGTVPIGGVDEMVAQGSTIPPLSSNGDDDGGCAVRNATRGSAFTLALGVLASLAMMMRRRRTLSE
jgi:uncharacterized protein (TIGR03382 family)